MKEIPILFSGPMSRAVIEDRKTQTRRVVKPQPDWVEENVMMWKGHAGMIHTHKCPYGQPGDVLWVREEYYQFGHWEPVFGVKTKTGRKKWKFVSFCRVPIFDPPDEYKVSMDKQNPYIPQLYKRLGRFMPRWACRTRLEVVSVRVERLQDISEEDAIKEGVEKIHVEHAPSPSNDFSGDFSDAFKDYLNPGEFAGWNGDAGFCCTAKESFMTLWASLYGQESLDANPYVRVIEYRRLA